MAERIDHKPPRSLFGRSARAPERPREAERRPAKAAPADDLIGLNLKALAGAAILSASGQAPRASTPSLNVAPLASRPPHYGDVLTAWYGYWAESLNCSARPHRKLWEFIVILQALYEAGAIVPGARTLCFGAVGDPLPSYLASLGLEVVATDLPDVADRDQMFNPELVDAETFDRLVEVSNLDMRRLDDPTLRDFDACWSASVLNQLGSMDEAMDTALGAMDVLKPGGVAVHTTDFAFADDMAFSPRGALAFPRSFFQRLSDGLNGRGHIVTPLSFDLGAHPLDGYVDLEPFEVEGAEAWRSLWAESFGAPHLKMAADGLLKTSFVFIVRARG